MSNPAFFEIVNYEYKILQFSYFKLNGELTKEERNCYLECFLLHSKVLLEFLLGVGHSKHSENFLEEDKSKEWVDTREEIYFKYDTRKKNRFRKFNALLSHIGGDRENLITNEKKWDVVGLFNTIKILLEKYSEYLEPSDKPKDWLVNFYQIKIDETRLFSQKTSDSDCSLRVKNEF